MKIGEVWKLKKHYKISLLKYVEKNPSFPAVGLMAKIVKIYQIDEKMLIIIKCLESGFEVTHERKSFLECYEKVYENR